MILFTVVEFRSLFGRLFLESYAGAVAKTGPCIYAFMFLSQAKTSSSCILKPAGAKIYLAASFSFILRVKTQI